MRKYFSAASAAIVIVVAQTTVAHAQNCLSQGDTGKTKCMAGVLYRCACSQIVGSTICSWNNAATACSPVSAESDALPTPIFAAMTRQLDRRGPPDY